MDTKEQSTARLQQLLEKSATFKAEIEKALDEEQDLFEGLREDSQASGLPKKIVSTMGHLEDAISFVEDIEDELTKALAGVAKR